MAGTVGSAVAQETVSGVFSFVLGKREEKASEEHNMERLETAHIGLEQALERTCNLPIIDRSLLRQRKMIKRVYEECGDVLSRHKLRVLEDKEAEQGATVPVNSSFPKRITHALKSSISSVIGLNRDGLNLKSDVARFEWLAGGASKFVGDVVSGCSLSHYRFFPRLFRKLCQGKTLEYKMAKESRADFSSLWVLPIRSGDLGVVVNVVFNTDPRMVEKKWFDVSLGLRLSESMDIVQTMRQSLQSLRPPFKSFAEDAVAELTQLLTEDGFSSHSVVPATMIHHYTRTSALLNPDLHTIRATAELSTRYLEHVMFMSFGCYISASESDLQSYPVSRTTTEDWRVLRLSVLLAPHMLVTAEPSSYSAVEEIGGEKKRINCSLHQVEEIVRTEVINRFICQRELMKYQITSHSTHGTAHYTVERDLPWGLFMLQMINELRERSSSRGRLLIADGAGAPRS